MKTSELKKIIEDNGCSFTDDKHCNTYLINFKNHKEYLNNLVAYVDKKDCYMNISSICPKVIAQAILDYAYTPLSEREEEKKYYLIVPFSKFQYLNLYANDYLFAGRIQEAGYKTQFTQKEIDAMPFDTNFFIKEEVK